MYGKIVIPIKCLFESTEETLIEVALVTSPIHTEVVVSLRTHVASVAISIVHLSQWVWMNVCILLLLEAKVKTVSATVKVTWMTIIRSAARSET